MTSRDQGLASIDTPMVLNAIYNARDCMPDGTMEIPPLAYVITDMVNRHYGTKLRAEHIVALHDYVTRTKEPNLAHMVYDALSPAVEHLQN